MNSYKSLRFVVLVLLFSGIVFSDDTSLGPAIQGLCGVFFAALPVILLLLAVLSAITYAVGQMLGAETRARATVWATSMITGAIAGAIIFILVPYVLGFFIPEVSGAQKLCAAAAGGSSGGGGSKCNPCGNGCCDPANEICVQIPAPHCLPTIGNKPCNPPCSGTKVCINGVCSGGFNIDPLVLCQASCDPKSGVLDANGICVCQ